MLGNQTQGKNNIAFYSWIVCFVITLVIYFIVFRRHGVEIQLDSSLYIRGALNLKAGLGYTHAGEPINHFPIGLSLMYYLLMCLFPASIYSIALYLHIVLLACAGILFKRIMQELQLAAPIQVVAFIVFFLSPPILQAGSKMLSELPSIVLILIGVLILLRMQNKPMHWTNSLWLGTVIGVGLLIRFAMIGLLAGVVCYVLWLYRHAFKQALLHAILVCMPGVLFMASYSLYINSQYQRPSVDRNLEWHPVSTKQCLHFFTTPFTWIFQNLQQSPTIGIAIFLLLVTLWKTSTSTAAHFKQISKHNKLMMLLIISVVYCLFIVVSISLFDASTPVDTRILSLIAVFFYMGLAIGFHYLFQYSKNKKRSLIVICFLGLFITWPAKTELIGRYKYPQCFNKPAWQQDARAVVNETAFRWIKPQCTIYTNSNSFWRICNNKKISRLPQIQYGFQQKHNPNFIEEMESIRNDIAKNQAQLIFFYDMPNHYNSIKKSFIDTFFSNTTTFNYRPFNRGIIIEAK